LTKTIKSADVQDLMWNSDGKVIGEWTRVAEQEIDQSRWGTYTWLVLQHTDETLWGLQFFRGATELQESEWPWEGHDDEDDIKLTRLHSFTREVVEYTDKP